MNKIVKRLIAVVVMLAVVLGITFWRMSRIEINYQMPESDAPVVVTIDGSEVRADEFASYIVYNMAYYENMYSTYGVMGLWSDQESAAFLGASMPAAALDQAVYSRVVLDKFNELGLELSYEQKKELSELRQSTIDDAGSYDNYLIKVAQYGFDDVGYTNFLYLTYCYSALNEYYYGENGINKPTDEELMNQFRDTYIHAKHILISTMDAEGNTVRSDEEAKAEAQAILDRINAGEDFDTLMNEYSEDTGLADYPDGYIFTEGQMVTEFYEGAKALEVGQVSGLIKSDYGYHIILREELDYENEYKNYQADLATALGKTMDSLLTEWMTSAKVETTDVYNEITYLNVYDYLPEDVAARNTNAGNAADAADGSDGAAETDGTGAADGAAADGTETDGAATDGAAS